MRNIRRLYLYAVSLVSLEVVLWGTIGLLRSIAGGSEIGRGNVDRLAGALALIVVGIPVFLLHWWLIQRSLQKDPEERAARIRAIFLYLVLLITLAPIVQNGLALVNHFFLQILGVDPGRAFLGSTQTWAENLIAILANAVPAIYFYRVLALDWQSGNCGNSFWEVRRLYRYTWLVYGLLLLTFGLQQLIQFILISWDAMGEFVQVFLANGLSLLVIGLPVWILANRSIQRSLVNPTERESLLRLIVLFVVVMIALIGCLSAVGIILYYLFQIIFGEANNLQIFINQITMPVSIALPMGLIWAYYHQSLSPYFLDASAQVSESRGDDQEQERDWQRRAELRRLYYYILALLGIVTAFVGLQQLLTGLLALLLGGEILGEAVIRDQLSGALAALIVGLPVWIMSWRVITREAARDGETGDYARRSIIRRSYLFLGLFVGVMGIMTSAGVMIYHIFLALLGESVDNLLQEVVQQFINFMLFGLLLVFHWLTLREDGRRAERSLAKRYGQLPVLILEPEGASFSDAILPILEREIPGLPVAVHNTGQGAPDPSLTAARVVILPAELASRSGEALRLWLQNFAGERVVLNLPVEGWYWIPASQKSLESLARQTAQAIRQMAEEGHASPPRENQTLMTVVYVFAALFGLELLLAAIGLVSSFVFR